MKQATKDKYYGVMNVVVEKLMRASAMLPGDNLALKEHWRDLWANAKKVESMIGDPTADTVVVSNNVKSISRSTDLFIAKLEGKDLPDEDEPELPPSAESMLESLPTASVKRQMMEDLKTAQRLLSGVYNQTIRENAIAKHVPIVIQINSLSTQVGAAMQEYSKLEGIK